MVCDIKQYQSIGTDYTKEYNIYKEIKDITSLDELRETLQNKKVKYTISSHNLSLSDYKNISFSRQITDNSWKINSNKVMENFTKLDSEDLSIVIISGELHEGKFVEKISISNNGYTFTKLNDNYYYKQDSFIYTVCSSLCISLSMIITIANISKAVKKRNTLKSEEKTSD